ncbi:ligase [GDP-forming] subunit beta, mitochondrial [Seminavis robusta]|uniref:Succinate--CoA ligase [ADP-forming] subunit beta, mitochondrial n=1 Tax=Seminavis robusta TaxID=568900 RepID=A0A9N8HLJ9_9STRA|nr:ligase [GDP-forming] subunit beta, mitochondrial [Seminavis robusta]|eukprot:Sro815_g206450.1 ligase [GDP-forming] subunit beta, mitochondrial (444) ;mRNA; f:6566-8083
MFGRRLLIPRHHYDRLGILFRALHVHEYISLELMKTNGIKTPECKVASTPEEAENIFLNHLNKPGTKKLKDVVIKAQVLSGGRKAGRFQNGFRGGIHMVTKPGKARQYAEQMLGQKLVTQQAPQGLLCNRVLLMERMYLRREMYLSIVMDPKSQGPVIMACPQGGTSIEQVAKDTPELLLTESIDIRKGLLPEEQCERMARHLGYETGTEGFQQAVAVMQNLYSIFIRCDTTQIEVNPLAETPEGDIVVCDAKVTFDDNAAYRQSSIFERRDTSQEDPREAEAAEHGLNYVGLEGNIGCMVNGAGLAMATLDTIKLKGGNPANFLDVGGGASETQILKAFEILSGDPSVKAILVNIFGGIMRCDVIATGIIQTAQELGIQKPIIIRLQGTNVNEARTLIEGCGFKMILANDIEDAATKAVGIAEIAVQAEKIKVGVKFDGLDL